MRIVLAVLFSAVLWSQSFALKDGDTVFIYGDAITDHRLHTTFAETYIVTRYPNLQIRFAHSGWGATA